MNNNYHRPVWNTVFQGRTIKALMAAAGMLLVQPSPGFGYENFYNNGNATGIWNDAGNWTAGIPTPGGGTSHTWVQDGLTVNINSGSATPWVLHVGAHGSNGTVIQAAGTAYSSTYFRMGRADGAAAQGSGTYIMNGGTFTTSTEFILGYQAGSSTQGQFLFVQNGGTVTSNPGVLVGSSSGSEGTIVVNSGAVFNNNGGIGLGNGSNGKGTLIVDGGTYVAGGTSTLGNGGSGSQGHLILDNGASGTFSTMRTGNNNGSSTSILIDHNSTYTGRILHTRGPSTIELRSGTLNMPGVNFIAGAEQPTGSGVGTYTQSGGSLISGGNLVLGAYTKGTATITGGSFNVGGNLYGGDRTAGGALSSMTVNNASISISGTSIVGQRGNFELNMLGGTYTANNMNFGDADAASNGTVNQSGGTVTIFNTMNANAPGTGTYNLEGGSLNVNAINIKAASSFNWNAGALSTATKTGSEGVINYATGPGFGNVYAGVVLDVTGDIDTDGAGGARSLNLGDVYLNGGARQNIMTVSGTLDLTGENDTLIMGGTPYFLRPFGFNSEDYGTIPLVSGTILENFETFIAPGTDGKGWSESAFAVSDPALLDTNTWYLEQTGAGIFFHYKVQGSVPEPGTLGLLIVGGLFLRRIRK